MDLEGSPRPLRRPRRLLLRTATLTVALLSVPAAALATHVFADVPHDHPHAKGIGYVAATGVTQGCDSSRYCPGDTLTRAQMGTFLHRASGNDPDTPPSVNAARLQGQPASAFARTSDLPQVSTVTESVGCIGTSFYPRANGTIEYATRGAHHRYLDVALTSSSGLECQVTPPQGARLTSIEFRVSDTSPSSRIAAVGLWRRGFTTTIATSLASLQDVTTDVGTPGGVTVTVPVSSADAVVDNGSFGYSLQVLMGPSDAFSNQFVSVGGATVTYEIDRLVP